MERGYLVDHGQGILYPTAWAAGEPRWSSWLGLRVKRHELLPVTTYRCVECGLLESYARPGSWPG
jgi:hypothetical protein